MHEIICDHCFHHCHIPEGKTGLCHVRANQNGQNVCGSYGKLTAIAMDPVEKKPLRNFHPGSMILSVGSYGCNLSCPFCQNYTISTAGEEQVRTEYFSPEQLTDIAMRQVGNLGIAFTYNEPSLMVEYIEDCAQLLHMHGMKTVLVSNGCMEQTIAERLARVIDAANIDLKGNADYYVRELGGDYDSVWNTIRIFSRSMHVEITTLVVPGKNDSLPWIEEEAMKLADLSEDIPLHLSRYFPRYKSSIPATPPETIYAMQKAAQKYLKYVYTGNL